MTQPFLRISWQKFHRDTLALAERLEAIKPWKGMIAITRGGLAPAAILSHTLNIRLIETVCLSSYCDQGTQATLNVLKAFKDNAEHWLVIDDIVDRGQTLKNTREMLPNAYFASLYVKPKGAAMVDAFLEEIDQETWVVFPWEEQKDLESEPAL